MIDTNKRLTIISCHFGDPYWIMQLIDYMNKKAQIYIDCFFIIDNTGNLASLQHKFPDFCKVLQIPNNYKASLQHAYTLQTLLRSQTILSDRVLIIDSDIIFINDSWIQNLLLNNDYDAFIAIQEGSSYLSHPCFNLISRKFLKNVNYLDGMNEFGFDTGRLVGLQLSKLGAKTSKLLPSKYMNNGFGYVYLHDSILHMTSASVRLLPSRKDLKFRNFKSFLVKWLAKPKKKFIRTAPFHLVIMLGYLNYVCHALSNMTHKRSNPISENSTIDFSER